MLESCIKLRFFVSIQRLDDVCNERGTYLPPGESQVSEEQCCAWEKPRIKMQMFPQKNYSGVMAKPIPMSDQIGTAATAHAAPQQHLGLEHCRVRRGHSGAHGRCAWECA